MKNIPKILIIGAGISGLAAANKLRDNGFNATVLEARNRIGGRIWTVDDVGIPFDLGASLIHGLESNPIAEIVKQHHIELSKLNITHSLVFDKNKEIISTEILSVFKQQLERLLKQVSELIKDNDSDISFLNAVQDCINAYGFSESLKDLLKWKMACYVLYYAAEAKNLSGRYWLSDTTLSGEHYLPKNGYRSVINALAKGIDIKSNNVVKSINMFDKKVKVITLNEVYEADAVIVTLPLGVLQNGRVQFNPELPAAKKQVIHAMKMGVLNKIILKFPYAFWPEDCQNFGYVIKQEPYSPLFVNHYQTNKQPILNGFVGDKAGINMEKLSDAEIVEQTMSLLKQLFGNSIPDPNTTLITRWFNDPYACGSYSYLPTGVNLDSFNVLAEPIENKIYFAGEATNGQYPATVHCAYLSGIREAERILKLFR